MKNDFSMVVKPVGVALALSICCCGVSLAQGMSEYAGVTSIPKPMPKTSGIAGGLNSIYGAPAKQMNNAARSVSTSGKTSSSATSVRTAQGAPAKKGKPAIIMSGDLPGSAIQAQREAALGVSKVANESYKAGLDAKSKGKLDEAEKDFRKSVNARMQYWSERDHKIPDIFVELGEINATRGNDQKAVEDLQQALAFYSKFHGPGSDHRLKPLLLLSESQFKLGEKAKSYESYKQAYQLATRAKLDAYNPVVLRLNTVKKAIEVNKFRDACEMCEIAMSNSEKPKMSQDQLLALMSDYATALRGLNRTRDAEEILAEAEKIKGSGPASTPQPPAGSETTAK
ncbi:tetratricopeptide repeat protein [Candidatus Obscuribacterales bacterium]|nr:tetratricopeptide repeat protein [Candidatus Obscuribacterales bacterium]MBX3134800.1 tetratricopeptide repeat protein [Candidatus Obscuribacterales bacterium]MBX3149553.1 tetratricopeptide repeat protein [Candidatus Obscuribacterales bacterium]